MRWTSLEEVWHFLLEILDTQNLEKISIIEIPKIFGACGQPNYLSKGIGRDWQIYPTITMIGVNRLFIHYHYDKFVMKLQQLKIPNDVQK